ncbi:MAG: ribosome biogenesis GTPase Der [Spirochaetia bacterium]|nr:ribosome biogenesis GTPase Der [Spirochaetia bacterium]
MPKIAVIGKQNVGKSTLFNSLIKKRISIEYDKPGVTRDLVREKVDWAEGSWEIIDFPGFEHEKEIKNDILQKLSIEKAFKELENCHLFLWIVSIKGLSSYEKDLCETLRHIKKPVWLVVNFVDDPSLEIYASDFYALGFKTVFFVSALNNRNIKDLREKIINYFNMPEKIIDENKENVEILKIAIIGKPNAGKSTLFNYFIKKEKALTSDIPGTTRDALKDSFIFNGKKILIVDTAGMRKRSKIIEDVEYFSINRTEKAAEQADVVLLLIDPHEGVDKQNKNIIVLLEKKMKPLIIAFNKSDKLDLLIKNNLEEEINNIHKIFWKIPIFFISSITGKNTIKIIEKAYKLKEKNNVKINTNDLNKFLEKMKNNVIFNQSAFKLNYITQAYPKLVFIIFSKIGKLPSNIHKFILKSIRKEFSLEEIPILLDIRKKS